MISQELARLSTPSADATLRSILVKRHRRIHRPSIAYPANAPAAETNPGGVTYDEETHTSTGSSSAEIASPEDIRYCFDIVREVLLYRRRQLRRGRGRLAVPESELHDFVYARYPELPAVVRRLIVRSACDRPPTGLSERRSS